jgi:hypothetical protein
MVSPNAAATLTASRFETFMIDLLCLLVARPSIAAPSPASTAAIAISVHPLKRYHVIHRLRRRPVSYRPLAAAHLLRCDTIHPAHAGASRL